MFTLDEYAKGFDKMLARPRASAKVILFPDKNELEQAKKRR
jgi:hypothetical protein